MSDSRSKRPQRNPDDSDGDGTVDVLDRCPDSGGPAQNQGCPEDASGDTATEEPLSLPVLPTTGDCVLATQGTDLVNVRDIPSLDGQIVAQLNPAFVYPVYFKLIVSLPDDIWYLTDTGWVFSSVVRLGGDCNTLATAYANMPSIIFENGNLAAGIQQVNFDGFDPASAMPIPYFMMQSCDGSVKVFLGAQDIAGCDGSVMPFDGMQNGVECDGSVHELGALPSSCPDQMPNFGILFNEDGEIIALILVSPGSLVGFNPQPDPPVDMGMSPIAACASALGLPTSGLEEVGFNPQPEPPPFFSCVVAMNGYGGPDSNEQGIIIVNGYGGPNADEQGIIIVNGYGGPNADEQGIIIINGYGGPNASEPPSDVNWTGITFGIGGNMLIGESEGQVYVCPGSLVGFNPQPEPPAASSSGQVSTGLAEVGFNPQPEPPAVCNAIGQ